MSKASTALLDHIKPRSDQAAPSKQNLLASDPSDSSQLADISLWLILTTKKHISDTARLKPSKIFLPHSLFPAGTTTVCLITASPQHIIQEVLAHAAFPPSLASQITKVITVQRLKTHYKSFESRRQLFSEHDLFLSDDKIVTQLPELLGKIFYKSGKRPIPVTLAPPKSRRDRDPAQKPILSNRPKRTLEEKNHANRVASPEQVARQLERTLSCTAVNLSPGVTTAIRIGLGNFTPEQLAENIETVISEMTERFVPQKWKNVKAIHIKGPESMAIPVWMTQQLWTEEHDISEIIEVDSGSKKALKRAEKRKEIEVGAEEESKKVKRVKGLDQEDDGDDVERRAMQIMHGDKMKRKQNLKKVSKIKKES